MPRPSRYVLPLLESRAESPSARTFWFSTEGTDFHFQSAQAVRVALPGVDDPWGAARMFSLSSSPTEKGRLSVTARISDTPFKQALAKLRPGDPAHVFGPIGWFPVELDRPSVFLAAGIGITPFRGMLRYAADRTDPHARRLLYVARTSEELVFREELDRLAREFPNIRVEYSVTRPADSLTLWTGRTGRLDVPWIREAARGLERPKYYVAGRPEMVEATLAMLSSPLGITEDDIDYEVFHGFCAGACIDLEWRCGSRQRVPLGGNGAHGLGPGGCRGARADVDAATGGLAAGAGPVPTTRGASGPSAGGPSWRASR